MLGYWLCPGHLYLFHDTLIYVPMMERLWNPTVLKTDLLATRPHLAFTIYDEVALGLRRFTGLDFREILTFEQWLFRSMGILGVYLVARALKLSQRMALLVAAIFSLGATTVGSALSSFEFEPVPRSFAFPLILLALGLAAHGRYLAAGVAGSVAFLYHPPIGYPFWVAFLVLALRLFSPHPQPFSLGERVAEGRVRVTSPPEPLERFFTKKRILAFLPLWCAAMLLFVLSRQQVGASAQDSFFRRLDPLQEQLQLATAPYIWISLWPFRWIAHHLFLGMVAGLAFWRLRKSVDHDLQFFLVGLPLVGILSMPASYILLEKMKWSLMPQFQPMRALVYLAVVTGITAAAAGIKAVERGHYLEGFLWLAVAFAIPTEARVLHILTPRLTSLAIPLIRRRVILVAVLALLACLAIWFESRRKRWAGLMLSGCMLVPFFLLPYYGTVNRIMPRNTPEVRELSNWARASTSKEAMFLFPDAGQDPDPSVFRATAIRSVYVDWLSNGQINFSREFTEEWWSRWRKVSALSFDPQNLENYSALGIDYLVLGPAHRITGETPMFENSRFVVYQVSHCVIEPLSH